jgi:hypothetical protein
MAPAVNFRILHGLSAFAAISAMTILAVASSAFAGSGSAGDWELHPAFGVGFNSAQGTSLMLGADFGIRLGEHWSTGLTGHFSSGNNPARDREYGGGVFLGYAQPLTDWLVGHVREELDYLDMHNPIDPRPATGPDYEPESGIAAITSVGLTFYITDYLAVSGGYGFVLGITNSDLGDGRSGPTFGLAVGI